MYVAKHQYIPMNSLVCEAISLVLANPATTSTLSLSVGGKTPEFFEGVMMLKLFIADTMGQPTIH